MEGVSYYFPAIIIIDSVSCLVGRKKRSPQIPFIHSYWVPVMYSTLHNTQYPVESSSKDSLGRFLLRDEDEPNYSVIHTDYDTYSVVYTCIPLPARVKKGIE